MAVRETLFRAAILTGYKEVALSLGLDVPRLLRSVGLHRIDLSDADVLIPSKAAFDLLERSVAMTKVDDFGLRMAERRSLAHLGPVGLVAREEPTLRAAIHLFERHVRLYSSALALDLTECGDIAMLKVRIAPAAQSGTRQIIELVVGVVFRTLKSLAGTAWAPELTSFSHPAPRKRTMHSAFFRSPLSFDNGFDGVVLRLCDLDAPIAAADPVMSTYIRRYLDSMLAQPPVHFDATVRQLVLTLLPSGRCTAEVVARHLGIDRRTLTRRLKAHGVTFSTIMNEIRVELVRRHVLIEERSLSEVAHLVGFAGLPVFSRWFRAEFGTSASVWRSSARTEGTLSTSDSWFGGP